MTPNRRINWMVNKELQEGFSRRLLVYWCGTWLAIFAVPICSRLIVTKLPFTQLATELISDMWFPMMMSLLVLPIIFWDCIRFSHRVAGPIHRISKSMRQFSDHENVAPIKLRENDFCKELAGDFNRVMETYSAKSTQPEIDQTEATPV